MTLDDVNEAVSVLTVAVTALQAAVPGTSGRSGAAFRYACGDLLASAPTTIPAATVGDDIETCFGLAVAAGASLNGLVALRTAVIASAPVGQPALWVAATCCFLELGAEAQILSAITFTSSNDALAALSVFGAAVADGQDWALNNHLTAQYQALLALGAAVSRDLQARAAPLPRLTTYGFPRGVPSLVLAYRLYGDAGRADELRAENQVINPAFMPDTGTALSE